MNSKKITPLSIKDKCTCYKCLKKDEKLNAIHIPELEYPSNFNGLPMTLYLCDECYSNTNEDWWKLEELTLSSYDDFGYEYTESKYKYDDEMFTYIKNLPVQIQEILFNRNSILNYKMDSQDWIDWKLGELPKEKCDEYGIVHQDVIETYKKRFSTCQYPVRKKYSDGSCGCYCFAGAYGELDQTPSINISKECYNCRYYKPRESDMIEIMAEEWEEYKVWMLYNLNSKDFEKKFSKLNSF